MGKGSADLASRLFAQSGLLPREEGVTRAWKSYVDGRPIEEVIGKPTTKLQILCVRDPNRPEETLMGILNYAAEPKTVKKPGEPDKVVASGYDTWMFLEVGGAVTLPFVILDGRLYVATVQQRRFCEQHPVYCPDGMIRNAPRGFTDPGSYARYTASQELVEEVGVFDGVPMRLAGKNVNPNNSWFSFLNEVNANGDAVRQGGVSCWAVEVKPEMLEGVEDGQYRIRPEMLGERPKGSSYEMIGNCLFEPVEVVAQRRDGFALCAITRLIMKLVADGRLEFTFHAPKPASLLHPHEEPLFME